MNMRRADISSGLPAVDVTPAPRAALVVDDDDMVRDTVAMQLEGDGWRVASASNIAEARAVLHADPAIAVVVCDIHLTSESGFELAEMLADLRSEQLATEIVFITGNASSDTAIEALRHRAFDLVRKPLRRADLVKRVAAAEMSAARRRQQQAMLDQLEHRVAEGEAMKRRLAMAMREAEGQNRELAESVGDARHDLLAVIAHELRTPLIPIVGLADILLNSDELSPNEVREFAEMIRDGGERLGAIIDRTLTYLDAERQQTVAEMHEFPIAALIDTALAKLPKATVENGCGFDIDCSTDLHAWGAADLLAEALAELLDNAIKASPKGASVRITACPEDDGRVAIEVTDIGPGLPEVVRRNIGTPFLQGDASTTRRWSGVGLGLARARKSAQLNGGTLMIPDPQPDTGARLRMILRSAEP
ncbi:hybrid sensor histidine kinase/response regulator [Pararhodobacter sp. SW119]|uniref:hybrid sensor histidine kinase/response regulator n=1 Tax=Pararhodobacter sp. SW119 TaxID=2780075 RepID=UPI001AE01272|nr:hybrid sensor histidine kinase/response regulator [Pararhodobacter sp. SW119]